MGTQSVLSRNMKNIRVFYLKFSVFGNEMFCIFELACFRNAKISENLKKWKLLQKMSRKSQNKKLSPTNDIKRKIKTVEPQWLEHLLDHENLF